MNIILLGPPGSGKSTQAKLLSNELGLSTLNVGDLLHYKSEEETKIGENIKETMKSGGLVDEALVTELVEEHLKGKEHEKGVIIDGYPRSITQAKKFSLKIDNVINYQVGDEVTKERLKKRGRKDDTEEVIGKRLKVYHEETSPILEFYKEKGVAISVNGENSIEEIFDETMEKLNG